MKGKNVTNFNTKNNDFLFLNLPLKIFTSYILTKKTKILLIAVTSLIVLNCVSTQTKQEQEKQAMEQILQKDLIYRTITLYEISNRKEIAETYKMQVEKMKQIWIEELDNSPTDFAVAYREYTNAYENAIVQLKEKEKEFKAGLLPGLITLNPYGLIVNVLKTMKKVNDYLNEKGINTNQIEQPYEKLKYIASRYKAKVPQADDFPELPSSYVITGKVEARKEWQSIYGLVNGKFQITLEATGLWSMTNDKYMFDAIGIQNNPSNFGEYRVDKTFNHGALICRISSNSKEASKQNSIFILGIQETQGIGVIECRINDRDINNNTGSLSVLLKIDTLSK